MAVVKSEHLHVCRHMFFFLLGRFLVGGDEYERFMSDSFKSELVGMLIHMCGDHHGD